MIFKKAINLTFLCLLSTFSLCAQEKPKEPTAPLRTFTIIPVGRLSDTKWVGQGERTKAIAIDPGATPPPSLFFKTPKNEYQTLRLMLNSGSPPAVLNKAKLKIYTKEPSDGDDKPVPFIEVNVPTKHGHYDLIMWRKKNKPDWRDARRLIVGGSYKIFPKNTMRLLNINPKPIRVQYGSKVEDIPANAGRILKLDPKDLGKLIRTKIAYADDQKWKFVLRTAVKIKDGQRINLIIYPSRTKERLCEVARFYQSPPPVIKKSQDKNLDH